jgi:hypothetical protein
VGALAGAAGVAFISALSLPQWNRRIPFGESDLYGLGLIGCGLVTNVLIAISRTADFFEHTRQPFADRYLFWSSVTWLGLCIYLLPRLVQAKRIKQYAAAVTVMLFSLAAVPPARYRERLLAGPTPDPRCITIAFRCGTFARAAAGPRRISW